ncbi:MAG: biofilm PGA synthesis N-glycosyltransferase PgaC [Sediminicola sp.]|jgi:biofilm PGA synthesis N-glycosyltransferase PgaC
MIYLFLGVGFLYTLSLVILSIGFRKLPVFTEKLLPEKTRFSIVIPFRNEAENLQGLLESLQKIKYPSHLFEVIFVDDASEDNSVKIIKQILEQNTGLEHFHIIKNERHSASPKKDAITAAITISKYEWILTTDADCTLPAAWLKAYDSFIQTNRTTLVAGPIVYKASTSIVEQFQKFDGLSLQLVTMGSFGLQNPILCNGANLAYRKEAFYSVQGFSENNHIASGDDIFILEKILKIAPKEVHFLKSKEAIVKTLPQRSGTDLINQRIRWTSKTAKQKSFFSKLLGMLVLLINFLILVGLIYCITKPYFLPYYLVFLIGKVLLDFYVITICNAFYRSKINLGTFLLSACIYPIATVIIVLGSLIGTYSWKGRKFEKQP